MYQYEMFKSAAETFYPSTDMESRCTKIELVQDKKQRHVETKFKIRCGVSSYTLNS